MVRLPDCQMVNVQRSTWKKTRRLLDGSAACSTDGRGKRVYLSDAIVIMTSNIESEHFRRLTNPLGFFAQQVGAEQVHGEVMRELERRFAPEFRNRIDEVVLFAPLSREEVREISQQYLAPVERALAAAGRSCGGDRTSPP
jgi:ATP-dependent Clp protease ATP-binding subunit ClpA